jgi:hypothetical protein
MQQTARQVVQAAVVLRAVTVVQRLHQDKAMQAVTARLYQITMQAAAAVERAQREQMESQPFQVVTAEQVQPILTQAHQ